MLLAAGAVMVVSGLRRSILVRKRGGGECVHCVFFVDMVLEIEIDVRGPWCLLVYQAKRAPRGGAAFR